MKNMSANKQEIFRKIRAIVVEFGDIFFKDNGICIISNVDYGKEFGGITHIYSPTGSLTLGNVDFKIARFFEDI